MRQEQKEVDAIRDEVKQTLKAADPRSETGDADYVFITFVLKYLPHGVIGLLIAVIFCAGDVFQCLGIERAWFDHGGGFLPAAAPSHASDEHYLFASKLLTAAWGGVAISFALFANLVENLIQAINILGSIFYGSILGIFLVAFFLRVRPRLGRLRRRVDLAGARAGSLLHDQDRLSLVQPDRLRRGPVALELSEGSALAMHAVGC